MLEKHDLVHELPEYREEIHELKMNDAHFARLFKDYHEVDHEVHRIESGAESTSDEYLETRKKVRLDLKDRLLEMLKSAKAEA
ncbi:MAG: GTP-binding protein [Cellvibrionaceae bacterium]|nr:GTP-binding protein [Cellvibrionaceae bacterium]|tara:strand:- start:1304 stop:1552 length:249 start_codon:yes stop_codon:yes gene_type:complete